MKRPHVERNGFTLLEVILVVGIMSVLLLAIYQSMRMYYAQLEAGREIAEEAQLVRALSQRISLDVRNSFTRWKPTQETQAAAETSEEEDSEAAEDEAMTEEAAVLAAEYATPEGGVLGYPDSVTLVVRVTPADLDFTATSASQTTPVTDVRMVRYWLANTANAQNGQPMTGLIREELYRMPDPSVGADPRAWARAEVLAEEVASLTIRYFDGSAWQETWDNTNTSAPMAVEFVLGLRQPQPASDDLASADPTVKYYRFLTSLPDTEPIEDADASTGTTTADTAAQGGI
jgi:prepilin-type N-terminal cleavage/methylation domain-containing protein